MKHGNFRGFYCLRRCPVCHRDLRTDGDGYFECVCGFADEQDVSWAKKHLNYRMPLNKGNSNSFNNRQIVGGSGKHYVRRTGRAM